MRVSSMCGVEYSVHEQELCVCVHACTGSYAWHKMTLPHTFWCLRDPRISSVADPAEQQSSPCVLQHKKIIIIGILLGKYTVHLAPTFTILRLYTHTLGSPKRFSVQAYSHTWCRCSFIHVQLIWCQVIKPVEKWLCAYHSKRDKIKTKNV